MIQSAEITGITGGNVSEEEIHIFLKDPGSYSHKPERVEIIQTHASVVAIAPPFVYKVKKAVNLGFLDFSTLAKRKYFCEREIYLNSRLCPGLYCGVIPITRNGDSLAFDGEGEVIDYAVQMKKLSEDGFLHHRVTRGELDERELDQVIEKLRTFYAEQEPESDIAEWGYIERIRTSTKENFEQTEAFVDRIIPRASYEAIQYYTNWFLDHQARLLNFRRVSRRILDCHGDLRLEHIHLAGDEVCIYDCIEFNDRLRYIDVASDTAFLAMDFDFHGRMDLGKYFVRRTCEALNDTDLLHVIDFYKCYRAYVKGKVEAIRSEEEEIPVEQQQKSRSVASRYFQLALRYSLFGSNPAVIVVMGRVGTGKTTIATLLSGIIGWDVLSSDLIRKEMAGVSLYERSDESVLTHLYSEGMTAKTYSMLRSGALDKTKQGEGVILDATYSRVDQRMELREVLQESGVQYCFVELVAPDELVIDRLSLRDVSEPNISDARLDDFDLLDSRYQAPDALEDAFHFKVDTHRSTDVTLRRLMERIIQLDLK